MMLRQMEFSLFYFASDDAGFGSDRYRLLVEGARFADEHGFRAVWMPERHFSKFGGPYPNPVVTAAALSLVTRNVELRAGSVVAPLHHPVRIAEDWAMVDNLSGGRVALSFAPGWSPDDFVLAPNAFDVRREVMLDHVDVVARLWRGEQIELENGEGVTTAVTVRPQPTRSELPIWLTTSGRGRNTETSALAGRLGFNVLTNFIGQRFDDVQERTEAYRAARHAAGHAGPGVFTLSMHTFASDDLEPDDPLVLDPLVGYLGDSFDLVLTQMGVSRRTRTPEEDQRDRQRLLHAAARRYMAHGALIGTHDHCVEIAEQARLAGVDEIACFVDFGVPSEQVLAALPTLARVARTCRDL